MSIFVSHEVQKSLLIGIHSFLINDERAYREVKKGRLVLFENRQALYMLL